MTSEGMTPNILPEAKSLERKSLDAVLDVISSMKELSLIYDPLAWTDTVDSLVKLSGIARDDIGDMMAHAVRFMGISDTEFRRNQADVVAASTGRAQDVRNEEQSRRDKLAQEIQAIWGTASRGVSSSHS
jgi:hypothetical protein